MYVHWVAVGGSVVSGEQMATRKVVYLLLLRAVQ